MMSAEQEFDLILMDIEMPEMDGLAATREIRQRETMTGTRVPIIAMTGHEGTDYIDQCLSAGMQGHIAKPIRAEPFNSVLSDL